MNSRGTWKVGKRGNLRNSRDVRRYGRRVVYRVYRVDSRGEPCHIGGNAQ